MNKARRRQLLDNTVSCPNLRGEYRASRECFGCSRFEAKTAEFVLCQERRKVTILTHSIWPDGRKTTQRETLKAVG